MKLRDTYKKQDTGAESRGTTVLKKRRSMAGTELTGTKSPESQSEEEEEEENAELPGTSQNEQGARQREPDREDRWMSSWSPEELKHLQQEDEIIRKVIEWKVQSQDRPDKYALKEEPLPIKTLVNQWDNLTLRDGLLYRVCQHEHGEFVQYVVPQKLRKDILRHLHDARVSGHLGIAKTLAKVRSRFYWPDHKADVARWCQSCTVCHSHKVYYKPKKAPMQLEKTPISQPLEKVACDILGPLPETDHHNVYILVVCDYFTKFVEAYPLPDQKAQTVADCIASNWIARYGAPGQLHTDQGRDFE